LLVEDGGGKIEDSRKRLRGGSFPKTKQKRVVTGSRRAALLENELKKKLQKQHIFRRNIGREEESAPNSPWFYNAKG